MLAQSLVDAGLVDINLGLTKLLDFACALRNRVIPFVFLARYHATMLPEDLSGGLCISKPADEDKVVAEPSNLSLPRN